MKIAAYTTVVLLLLFAVGLVVMPRARLRAWHEKAAAEKEAFQTLSSAKTQADYRAAVGDLGAYFSTADGEWVAIHYRDSHTWPGWSTAVATDSGGRWWKSHEHYCGRFKIYRKLLADDLQKHSLKESEPVISALDSSQSLQDARVQLKRLGFEQTGLAE